MSYPAKTIANYFIKKAIEKGDRKLNPMKLIKLIYIAHGWSLAMFDQPLINENVEAWKYGPVIARIYHAVKHWGMSPIKEIIEDEDINSKGELFINRYDEKFDQDTEKFLTEIIDIHKDSTGIELSNWTHEPGSPWHKAWYKEEGGKDRDFIIMPNNDIKEYFIKFGTSDGYEERKSKK